MPAKADIQVDPRLRGDDGLRLSAVAAAAVSREKNGHDPVAQKSATLPPETLELSQLSAPGLTLPYGQ
jgi:hypothetical protein